MQLSRHSACALVAICLIAACWPTTIASPVRTKRDAFSVLMKKKSLGAAATAIIAASAIAKKKVCFVEVVVQIVSLIV